MEIYKDEKGRITLVDGVDDFGTPLPLGYLAFMKTIADISAYLQCSLEEAKAIFERDGVKIGSV